MQSILTIILFLFILTGCESKTEDTGFVHVKMMDNFFSPRLSRIPKGGLIEFSNRGLNPHNAIAVDKSWSTEKSFGDLIMPAGALTRVTYPEEGIFPYYCSFHASPNGKLGMVATAVVGNVDYSPLASGKKVKVPKKWSGITRHVPKEHPTIQNAVDAANPGDLVLIDKGVYREEVLVTTPGIIVRGVSRSETIIDGEFVRGNGILVIGADGVAIENLTARNATLNGIFWTGVNGYRGSYLTTYNNGDYGLYAFDSTDGLFDHNYGSGHPDSSFYVGQCYPCKAILYDNLGENNAMGYSGTNSGGDLYLINNIFRNNMMGAGPNTLDSELLPPERETTLIGNILLKNNNLSAPTKPLMYPSAGNGVMIAGGLRNRIEKNLILGQNNNGIIMMPNMQENVWLSHDNTVKNNIILDSGRADLAITGPVSVGNCFEDNSFNTSIPWGLSLFQSCSSPLRMISGGELSMMLGALAMTVEVKLGFAHSPDYKTQPIPATQIEMPESSKQLIQPAVDVFAKNKELVKQADWHPQTKKIMNEYGKTRFATAGLLQPVLPWSLLSILFHIFTFLLPISIYATWTTLAFIDIQKRSQDHYKLAWIIFIILTPYLGSFIWHLRKNSSLARHLRLTMLLTGSGIFALFLSLIIFTMF